MKKLGYLFSIALLFASTKVSHADRSQVTVARIGSWGNGNVFFMYPVTLNGVSGYNTYYWSISTEGGKTNWTVVLTAYALGKTVSTKSQDASCVNCTTTLTQVYTDL